MAQSGTQGSFVAPMYDVLLVGCGNIAGRFDMLREKNLLPATHAGSYTKHGGFRLRACVDCDNQRLQEFAQHWNIDVVASEISDLGAECKKFDVISICSPTNLHYQHVSQALELRPRVIFCEKPLTSQMEDASRLVNRCKDLGVTLVVNYNRRWDPVWDEFVTHIQEGYWGEVRSVVGHYNKGILNNGSHMIDLLLNLMGPMELVDIVSVQFDFRESDPTVAALLASKNGKVPVYLNAGCARDFAFFELEVICELGVIRMLSGGAQWQVRKPVISADFTGYRYLGDLSEYSGGIMETMSFAVEDIYKHLTHGSGVKSLGVDALKVQDLCIKIQKKALSMGKRVKWVHDEV